jgi:Peptidase A4 family
VKRLVLYATSAVMTFSSVVLVTGGWSPAGAASAGVTASTKTVRGSADVFGRLIPASSPRRSRTVRGVEDLQSSNWSGYAEVSSKRDTFTQVTDTFVVPTVDTDITGTQYVADWVGIGGYDDATLVQTGIQAMVRTHRHQTTVTYDAWTEHLPEAEKPLELTISAGDTVTATVTETATNTWLMEVDDVTTGQSAGLSVPYKSSGESAEVINERPCIRAPCAARDLANLAQTPDITFGPGFYSVTAVGQDPVQTPLLDAPAPPSTISLFAITMTNDDGDPIATPSAPDASGEAFAVADGSLPPSPPS